MIPIYPTTDLVWAGYNDYYKKIVALNPDLKIKKLKKTSVESRHSTLECAMWHYTLDNYLEHSFENIESEDDYLTTFWHVYQNVPVKYRPLSADIQLYSSSSWWLKFVQNRTHKLVEKVEIFQRPKLGSTVVIINPGVSFDTQYAAAVAFGLKAGIKIIAYVPEIQCPATQIFISASELPEGMERIKIVHTETSLVKEIGKI
ncbi:MAG: hypothetical protein ACRDBG_03030 [Waterburya sp.]